MTNSDFDANHNGKVSDKEIASMLSRGKDPVRAAGVARRGKEVDAVDHRLQRRHNR